MVWNSVVSTPGAKYAAFDVGDFYLETPLDEYEYMKMPLESFPHWTKDQYDLETHTYKGFVYWEIRKAIYGLPQAGALANKQLKENLRPRRIDSCICVPPPLMLQNGSSSETTLFLERPRKGYKKG